MNKTHNFTVYIEQDEDGIFVGSVPNIPGCYAQGITREEMLKNLNEVIELCLRNIKTSYLGDTNLLNLKGVVKSKIKYSDELADQKVLDYSAQLSHEKDKSSKTT